MGTRALEVDGDPLIGTTLGNYVVRESVGQGGMGKVYLAEQPDIGKKVAIKVLKAEIAGDPENLKQLEAEARTVNAIRHRGIIDIFGFGKTRDGREYIVMEYLNGEPLDGFLARRKKVPAGEVARLLEEVLSALAAAHRAGVVHRDLKPGNIFVVQQSDGTRYTKVLDFGLAKRSQRPFGSAAQTAFRPSGTPEYMAPEQARGESVSPRTDLYAMGVIAFELLTGDIPFNGPSVVEIMMKQVQDPPPSLRALEPSVPVPLEALVLELLAKNPQARPGSADLVRRRLKQLSRFLQESETYSGAPPLAPDAPTRLAEAETPRAPEPLAPVPLRKGPIEAATTALAAPDLTEFGKTPVTAPPAIAVQRRRTGEKAPISDTLVRAPAVAPTPLSLVPPEPITEGPLHRPRRPALIALVGVALAGVGAVLFFASKLQPPTEPEPTVYPVPAKPVTTPSLDRVPVALDPPLALVPAPRTAKGSRTPPALRTPADEAWSEAALIRRISQLLAQNTDPAVRLGWTRQLEILEKGEMPLKDRQEAARMLDQIDASRH